MKPSKIEKSLILIRHAHRNTEKQNQDNGLTDKGRGQAENAAQTLSRIFAGTQPTFQSSPKKRCMETLTPVAERFGSKVTRNPLLLEQEENESSTKFENRIRKFLNEWKEGTTEVTFICSHGDWLPVAAEMLIEAPCEFKKGGWVEIKWADGDAWLNFPN